MSTFETTITRNDVDVEIQVEYNYYEGTPPTFEDPGDEEILEIERVTDVAGIVLTLSEKEMREVEGKVREYISNDVDTP